MLRSLSEWKYLMYHSANDAGDPGLVETFYESFNPGIQGDRLHRKTCQSIMAAGGSGVRGSSRTKRGAGPRRGCAGRGRVASSDHGEERGRGRSESFGH